MLTSESVKIAAIQEIQKCCKTSHLEVAPVGILWAPGEGNRQSEVGSRLPDGGNHLPEGGRPQEQEGNHRLGEGRLRAEVGKHQPAEGKHQPVEGSLQAVVGIRLPEGGSRGNSWF